MNIVRRNSVIEQPRWRWRGQSTLETVVTIAAVTIALVVMADYVRRALNAHAESLERQLNGATDENRP